MPAQPLGFPRLARMSRRSPVSWIRGLSLADKCLVLFGGAVVLIVCVALAAPWFRMFALVEEGQLELSRTLASVWLRSDATNPTLPDFGPMSHAGVEAERITLAEARRRAAREPFVRDALRRFERDIPATDHHAAAWDGPARVYRYAKAERAEGGRIDSILLLERRSEGAPTLLAVNTLYLLSAAFFVLALAVVVFYQIIHRIILSPVRQLKRTAERVRGGELQVRSDITTGDEFEELAATFNQMLANLEESHDQLRAINAAMDLKLTELAQANVALYQTAKLKSEFLANVSHELRTPLNSIIGFAELLLEIARAEQTPGETGSAAKRVRYLDNIVAAGRNLLDMIEDLLAMARLEAGRVELNVDRLSLREATEALAGLIHPLADRRGIEVRVEAAPDLPVIETDPRKFQQIVFNFLSNAVKFIEPEERTGRKGRVTLRAERLPPGPDSETDRVRVSVIDNGPGIPPEHHETIFEKFRQLDAAHTREHSGTGLGLAIARELASLIQGEIQLVSEPGRGSMFSLIVPVTLDPERIAERTLEARFRGALAGSRDWT